MESYELVRPQKEKPNREMEIFAFSPEEGFVICTSFVALFESGFGGRMKLEALYIISHSFQHDERQISRSDWPASCLRNTEASPIFKIHSIPFPFQHWKNWPQRQLEARHGQNEAIHRSCRCGMNSFQKAFRIIFCMLACTLSSKDK